MDSQIFAVENNQPMQLYTATGKIFNTMDVLSLEKDEIYTMD